MFALEERASGLVVGFGSLVHPGGQSEAEIKYAFLRSHWGLGLASEAVPALLAYGASQHRLRRIIATVDPENIASQRVLAKAGMVLVKHRSVDESTFVFECIATDPLKYCQQGWIEPVRVVGIKSGRPQWGRLEKLVDGTWREIELGEGKSI